MPDDSDPIAPPLDAPPLNVNDSRPDPGVIEGRAKDLGSDAPPGSPEAATETAAPRAARDDEQPTRGSFAPLWLAASALAGAALALGVSWLLNPPPDLSKINARIGALESANVAALDDVNKRLASLNGAGGALAASAAVVSALQKRVGALEQSVGELAKAAKAAPASGDGAPAPDMAPITARLDALEAGAKDLSGKADALAPLPAKVAALEAALAQEKSQLSAAAAAAPHDKGAALAVMVQALTQRFEAGAPFIVELEALKPLGASDDALSVLAPLAPHGAPTMAELAASFDEAAPAILAAEAPPEQGFTDRVMGELSSLVRVHPKGVVAGESPEALVTQIRAALGRQDLPAALAAFDRLPDKARAAGEAWRASAEARGRGLSALAKLRAEGYAALKPASP